MSNVIFTDLPTVTFATQDDVICAVQANVSVQETLGQVFTLMLANTILSYHGNPNGNLAGKIYQLCWDTLDDILYICTITGSSSGALWVNVFDSALITPSQGGTGVSDPPVHTLPVAEGSANFNFLGPLTNGQLLIGSTGADPVPNNIVNGTYITWTNGAGTLSADFTGILPPSNGGSGIVNPLANAVLIGEGSGSFNSVLLNTGQVLGGSTGFDPLPTVFTSDGSISIGATPGSISLIATGFTAYTWTPIVANTVMASFNGYFVNGAASLNLTLPALSNVGDTIYIVGGGAAYNGWAVIQGAGQNILIGSAASTVGVGGLISSTDPGDSIYLVCSIANTQWIAPVAPQGNITVV